MFPLFLYANFLQTLKLMSFENFIVLMIYCSSKFGVNMRIFSCSNHSEARSISNLFMAKSLDTT